jgi:hypothetical protein
LASSSFTTSRARRCPTVAHFLNHSEAFIFHKYTQQHYMPPWYQRYIYLLCEISTTEPLLHPQCSESNFCEPFQSLLLSYFTRPCPLHICK